MKAPSARHTAIRTASTLRKGWVWLRPYVVLALLLLVVRFCLLGHARMVGGQHALVGLTYYGLRVPGEGFWGYHRWGYRVPAEGDPLVFTVDDGHHTPMTMAGVCRALPGQTVWIDPVRRIVIPGRTSPDAQPIVIPGQNHSVRVTPYNARLLAFIMRQYEHCTSVEVDTLGHLLLGGQPLTKVRLMRDYYWVETCPDSFILVPHDALVGKVVYYKP